MDRAQPPTGGAKGPPKKKRALERDTTLVAAAAATAIDGEMTIVSTIDGGSATVTAAALNETSTLAPDDIKLDCSEPVPIPFTLAAIHKAIEWIQHGWHLKIAPLSDEAQAAFVAQFAAGLAGDIALFTAVLKAAHFLGLDSLITALLASLTADSDAALLQACLDPLASHLKFPKRR